MSGKRVLALYAVILFGFAVVLCRIYFLAQNPAYAARAEAQSTVSLALPTRRGNFYDCNGLPLTGLEMRWQTLCFPGENNYPRLYSETDSTGQATLYQNRNRAAPFCWKPCATFPRLACAASRQQNDMRRCRCASI